jgi:hypothetical protein
MLSYNSVLERKSTYTLEIDFDGGEQLQDESR